MFETLTEKLTGVFRRLGSHGTVTEKDLDEALREVRLALLEADVHFRVVREFLAQVRERALGAQVLKSLTPAQQVVGIVNEELVKLLGGGHSRLEHAPQPPTLVMLVGLQGSGKTTTAAKLALHVRREGQRPLLVAADIRRPAAIEQLVVLGQQLDIPVYRGGGGARPLQICEEAVAEARRGGASYVIIDTAGRLHIDEEMMAEVAELRSRLNPTEVLLVADAMTGQDAVRAAEEFHRAVSLSGLILTKMDGDARGGAALSIRQVTGVPIKFIGVGEHSDALESFHPDRIASRILGMGDVVTLVEKAQQSLQEGEAERLARKIKRGGLDLGDFLEQLQRLKKMGPLGQVMQMVPGFSQLRGRMAPDGAEEGFLKKAEAIILSMTPAERRNPDIIDGSRRRRIARGSGTTPQDVNQLLKQYREARKIIQMMSGGMRGPLSLLRR